MKREIQIHKIAIKDNASLWNIPTLLDEARAYLVFIPYGSL